MKTADGGGEYGRMPMTVVRDSTLFSPEQQDSQLVWMSHGDEAVKLPEGFAVVARSEQGAIVAIENPERRIFGLQYHPEVAHRCCTASWDGARVGCAADGQCLACILRRCWGAVPPWGAPRCCLAS